MRLPESSKYTNPETGPWAITFGRVIPTVVMGYRSISSGSRPVFPACGLSS